MNPLNTRISRIFLAIGAAVGLSACASVDNVDYNNAFDQGAYETTTRALPVASDLNAAATGQGFTVSESYKVVGINVQVPETLTVSEANRYLPKGDIVWREDPLGNRHEQVRTIVHNALSQGVSQMDGSREVILDVIVTRFHALTEKARYTVGGVHAIQFNMQLRDAESGEVVMDSKFIKADFDALGGRAAIRAESQGITQKVRITNHLAHVIKQELGSPEGYVERDTGFIGAINQI